MKKEKYTASATTTPSGYYHQLSSAAVGRSRNRREHPVASDFPLLVVLHNRVVLAAENSSDPKLDPNTTRPVRTAVCCRTTRSVPASKRFASRVMIIT